ncbi:MAG: DUF6142 family protein [Eubacterium sp.]|nr:DUF6142 family protein [Eubacterium sp.]
MLFRKKRRIQFTDKKHPRQGIISSIMGAVAIIVLLMLFIFSGRAKGHAGILFGYMGILDFILAVAGFVMAIRCIKQEEIYYTTVRIGVVSNGIVGLCLLVLYIVGLA